MPLGTTISAVRSLHLNRADRRSPMSGANALSHTECRHFTSMTSPSPQFVLWKGDEPKRKRFLNGLLSAMERHVDYVVACSVSMKYYKAVNRKYGLDEFMKPYTLVASNCAGSIIHWARGEPGNKLHPCTKFR